MNWKNDERPEWDAEFATSLVGARILIGVTFIESDGSEKVEQMYGVCQKADREEGIRIELDGLRKGEVREFPPDLRGFFPASPGQYRLKSTGEIVIDPDFTSVWTVRAPVKH